MYTNIEQAIAFMIKANKGMKIKNTNIDKCLHSVLVGNIMEKVTNTEEVIIVSYLHDIINDTMYGYEEIEEKFGTLVADMVQELSEDMSITKWLDRKKDFIKRIKKCNDYNIINIMVADKLEWLSMLYSLFIKDGDKIWKTFGGSKQDNCYYYRELYNVAKDKGANAYLLNRYKNLIKIYFGDFDEEDI